MQLAGLPWCLPQPARYEPSLLSGEKGTLRLGRRHGSIPFPPPLEGENQATGQQRESTSAAA